MGLQIKNRHLVFAFLTLIFTGSCREKMETNELMGIITVNDLNISLHTENDKGYEIRNIPGNEDATGHLEIDVTNEFAVRGKEKIEVGIPYKLSVTLKNEDANPLVLYSFWRGPVTSVRSFTLAGENGNPPTSETQKHHSDWVTFEKVVEAQNDEDSFMLTILSQKGTFNLKEIKIESLQ